MEWHRVSRRVNSKELPGIKWRPIYQRYTLKLITALASEYYPQVRRYLGLCLPTAHGISMSHSSFLRPRHAARENVSWQPSMEAGMEFPPISPTSCMRRG